MLQALARYKGLHNWIQSMVPAMKIPIDHVAVGQLLEPVETSERAQDKLMCLVRVREALEEQGTSVGMSSLGVH